MKIGIIKIAETEEEFEQLKQERWWKGDTNQKKLDIQDVQCSNCGKTIVDEDGHTAEDIIKFTKCKFKKILCPKCQKEES